MDVCLFWMLCVVRYSSLWRTDPSSRGVLPIVCVCARARLCIIECDQVQQWPSTPIMSMCNRLDKERKKTKQYPMCGSTFSLTCKQVSGANYAAVAPSRIVAVVTQRHLPRRSRGSPSRLGLSFHCKATLIHRKCFSLISSSANWKPAK